MMEGVCVWFGAMIDDIANLVAFEGFRRDRDSILGGLIDLLRS
jgi:hypothetical protein